MKLKKYLYVLMAVAGAVALAACSADEGTEPGSDGSPVVTIYSYAAPDGYDADVTTLLRVVPNNQVDRMYVLTELSEDKEAYISSNGEQAYVDRVISEGTEYEGTTQDLVITDLMGYNTTTVVAVAASGARSVFENVFKGVLWVDGGQAVVAENIAGLSGTVQVERQSDANIFRVVGLYTQLDPSLGSATERFTFTFEGTSDAFTFTEFSTTEAPFFVVGLEDGAALYHGYYLPSSYPSYCFTQAILDDPNGPCACVTCLILDNNAGSLYTGGQIKLYTSDLNWLE